MGGGGGDLVGDEIVTKYDTESHPASYAVFSKEDPGCKVEYQKKKTR